MANKQEEENKSLSEVRDKITKVVNDYDVKYYVEQSAHLIRFLSDQSLKMFLGREYHISDNLNKVVVGASFFLAYKTNSILRRLHLFTFIRWPMIFVLYGASISVLRKSLENFSDNLSVNYRDNDSKDYNRKNRNEENKYDRNEKDNSKTNEAGKKH